MEEQTSVVIFLGAGAESEYGMPIGADFKTKTILCDGAIALMKSFNVGAKDKTGYLDNVTRGKFIRHNSTNVLYQSYMEASDSEKEKLLGFFSEDEQKTIENYANYRHKKPKDEEGKKEVIEAFVKLYREKIYDPITKMQDSNNSDERVSELLNCLSFYSSIDEDFNYLRLPDVYKKECCNVMKLYFSAYSAMLEKIFDSDYLKGLIENDDSFDKDKFLREYYEAIKNKTQQVNGLTYYNVIKDNLDSIDSIVTTNYTHIIDEVLGGEDSGVHEKCIHIHGTMTEFEGLRTKSVRPLNETTGEEIVFPYILIQSGVKPVINPKQIEAFNKAFEKLQNSTDVIVLGYSFSSDDEHVITIFKELVKDGSGKKVHYLHYVKDVQGETNDAEKKKIEEEAIESAKQRLEKIFEEDHKNIDVQVIRGALDFKTHLLRIIG